MTNGKCAIGDLQFALHGIWAFSHVVPICACVCRKTVSAQATFEKDLFSKMNRGQQRSLDGGSRLCRHVLCELTGCSVKVVSVNS